MPQHLHGDSGVDVEVGQERGAGPSGAVNGDRLDACLRAPRLPGALEVAWLDGRAIAGGEYEAVFVPRLSGGCSCLVALLLSELEGGQADVGQGESGVRRLGLGVAMEELPADSLQLAADGQLSGIEVYVLPRQSQGLALAESGDEDQGIGGVERVLVGAGRFEEPVFRSTAARVPVRRIGRAQPLAGRVCSSQPENSGDAARCRT